MRSGGREPTAPMAWWGSARAAIDRRGVVLALFLLWAAWLALPYFALGPDSYVRIHDNADSTLALRVSLRSSAPSHLVSSWNPLPLAGLDQGPLINCGFDADGWLFALLPGWLAYGLIMFAQRFISGYFTWRLARDRLRVGRLASLCAGVAYAVFAQPTINADWAGTTLYDGLSLAALPLLLWALDGKSGWSLRKRVILGATLGATLGLTSHYSGAVFVVIAVCAWVLARGRRSLRGAAAVVGAFALTWAAAETPSVWSSMLNSSASNRADWADYALTFSAAMARQFSYVTGILRDNLVMVAAGAVALVAVRARDRRLVAAAVVAGVLVVIILAAGVWLMGYRRFAGPISGFQVDRFYLLLPFALVVVGALGLEDLALKLRGRVRTSGGSHRIWAAGLTILALLLLGPLASARVQLRIVREMKAGSTYAAVYQRPELAQLAARGAGSSPFRVATVYAPQVFPGVADSYWPFLFGPLPGYAWAYGLETVDGYVQMYPQRYQDYWARVTAKALSRDPAAEQNFRQWGNRVYLSVPDDGLEPSSTVRLASFCDPDLLSLANVRYVISPVRLSGSGLVLFSKSTNGDPWPLFIYENARVLPRFFVVHESRVLPGSSAVLDALDAATSADLETTAFLEQGEAPGSLSFGHVSRRDSTRVDDYQSDRVSLTVTAASAGLLVASVNYSPYWRAFVDGREIDVVPVDEAFMGVPVLPGGHEVELRYDPPSAKITR